MLVRVEPLIAALNDETGSCAGEPPKHWGSWVMLVRSSHSSRLSTMITGRAPGRRLRTGNNR